MVYKRKRDRGGEGGGRDMEMHFPKLIKFYVYFRLRDPGVESKLWNFLCITSREGGGERERRGRDKEREKMMG